LDFEKQNLLMHPIIYYIILFLAVGAAGMAVANRKVENTVRQQRWLKYFTYILFTGLVVAAIFYNFFYAVAFFIVLAAVLELLIVNFSKPAKPVSHISFSLLILFISATGFIFFAKAFHYSFLLFIYFQVLVFDGFCQITGQLFGKTQLVPAISPAKTAEGLAGGWIFCIGAAMMAANWVSLQLYIAALYGLLTGLTCLIGDLLASYYKRKVGIKDYSNWLPGQGGFLDRFDSFIVTAAVYFLLYITLIKKLLPVSKSRNSIKGCFSLFCADVIFF
jgi:phosphatidate cytidylyltransferase